MSSFRNKLISAFVASAGAKVEGNERATSRIWGLRLCPVLAPLEDRQLPQIPPQNLHLVPKICQFRANPPPQLPKRFTCIGDFGTLPSGAQGGGVDGPGGDFGSIPGDFSKDSGSQEGEKGILFRAENGVD